MTLRPLITLSIVSHGQGELIRLLLADLRQLKDVRFEILITHNTPEDEAYLSDFSDLPLSLHRNNIPEGFGANHNAAFARSLGDIFVIVNPDIRMPEPRLAPMVEQLRSSDVGACSPLVLSSQLTVEDSARRFPNVRRLVDRKLKNQPGPDYDMTNGPVIVDWLAGMFVGFRRDAFAAVCGFDERFFMYMEDADICRRLGHSGLKVVIDPSFFVIHDARRASRRSLKHLAWHLRSTLRFLFGI